MKKFNTITGEELLAKEIREIPFVVKDLIPVGLALLAGAAKAGKSWLALWLCIAIAKGEAVWGYESQKCTTLYLCYEDNEIHIQNRLLDITDEAPSNVHFRTEAEQELLLARKRGHALFIVGAKRLHINFEILDYKMMYMGKVGGR